MLGGGRRLCSARCCRGMPEELQRARQLRRQRRQRRKQVRMHTSAYVSIRQHESACVSMRQATQHTSAYVSFCGSGGGSSASACARAGRCAYVSIAYVSIRWRVRIRLQSIRQHTSAYVSIRQHTSAHVSTRQHTSAYASIRMRWYGPQQEADVC
jgi:hypothetical protein